MKRIINHKAITTFWILGVLLLTIIMLLFNKNNEAILLVSMPLIYLVLFIIFAEVHRYYSYPGMFVLNFICLMRYIIMPFFILFDQDYQIINDYFFAGIRLMVYEQIIVGVFLIFITRYYYKKYENVPKAHVENSISNRTGIVFKIVLLLALIVAITNPTSLSKFNFFISTGDVEIFKYGEAVAGFNSLILDWTKLILPLLIASYFIKKYKQNRRVFFYLATVFVVLFFNLMIFTGISRNSAILPGAASLFFLIKVFPDRKKITFLLVSGMIVTVTFTLTVFKTTYLGVNEAYTFTSVTKYLESYFVGPRNLGIALNAKDLYGSYFNLGMLFNDLFGNAPGISQFFNLENRTSTLYNLTFHNGGDARDAIIPTTGQGLLYTGYVFSFLPLVILIWIMAKFDGEYSKASDILSAFFMAYFALRFGFNSVQNVSIISGVIFSMILPLYTLIYINKNVRINFKGRN